MVSPGASKVVGLADLCTSMPGVVSAGTSTLEGGESTGGPLGGSPVAVAVLVIPPASRSAKVVTCVAVHVDVAPGPRGLRAGVHEVIAPSTLSLRLTGSSVTLPVLVTT